LIGSSAQAQTAATSRIIDVTFTGVVAGNVADTIQIRQPDGSVVPYTGPVPDFPYLKGDAVTIGFKASVPTKAFYDTVYQGQKAVDGIYRFRVSTPATPSYLPNNPRVLGDATVTDVSGPFTPSPNFGEPPFTSMTIVYDSNADTYSMEGSGGFNAGSFFGAGYTYDPATGTLASCANQACGSIVNNYNSFTLSGDASGSTISSSAIFIPNAADPINDYRIGKFGISFSGGWNLPQWAGGTTTGGTTGGTSGGSTPVPEPGMLLLFGAAAAALPLRRRKLARAA
jgi:hypothetical protein